MAENAIAGALAAAVLAVALFCAARLVAGAVLHRPGEPDADIVHVVMGVSMAGMLTGWLTGTWNTVWGAAFLVSTAWFARGVWRGLSGPSGRTSASSAAHHLSHLIGSAAMVYMLVAMRIGGTDMRGGEMSTTAPMTGPIGVHGGIPVAAALLAALIVANAALAAGRKVHALESALAPANPGVAQVAGRGKGAQLTPRASAACLVVMSVSMAYMVLALRP